LVPDSERLLVVVLLANQAVVLVLALFLTNAFHFRYAIVTFLELGITVGFTSHVVFMVAGRMRSVFLTGLITCFLVLAAYQGQMQAMRREQLHATMKWLATHCPPDLPIVLGDSALWYQVRHYGDPALADRCHYLADPQRSIRYLSHDTVDRCGLALRPWFPHDMQPYDDFLRRHDQFLVFAGLNDKWCWLPSALLDDQCQVQWIKRRNRSMLARVSPVHHVRAKNVLRPLIDRDPFVQDGVLENKRLAALRPNREADLQIVSVEACLSALANVREVHQKGQFAGPVTDLR
jgi:hypothetical protein